MSAQLIAASIKAAEKRRCDAMLAGDVAALDAVLDARLVFAHATGAVDDKAAYLAKLAAGRIRYVSIDWNEEQVITLAHGAALLTGRMATVVEVEGVRKALDNRVVAVWAHNSVDWQVVAFQSTPMKN